MELTRMLAASALAVLALAQSAACRAAGETITLASTTSTENSGLLDDLLPRFREKTGITVHAVAVGTGQALRLAERGDADVVLVHDPAAEERFVAAGWGLARHEVMYNDFVLVGPRDDPAGIRGSHDAADALRKIAARRADFASRADDSGTHKAELRLWQAAGVDPSSASGSWYLETGQGQGATLNLASARGAYALTDRGTWISYKNRGDLELLVEGDPRLFNQYGVIQVNPARHPQVHAEAARRFVEWLLSDEGQAAIAAYRVDGQQLFVPNAKRGAAGGATGPGDPGAAGSGR